MKIIKWIVVFLGTFVLYLMLFSSFFPVDGNNVIQAPDWFILVGFAVSIFSAIYSAKKKPVKESKKRKLHISRKIKYALREMISYAKAKKKYNDLSEAEKWKLERESNAHTESAMQRPRKEELNEKPLVSENASKSFASGIDISQIIEDEIKWRREQQGLSETDYELGRIDKMEGHQFEHWCADLLKKNGFSSVEVTVGSGDQGVDVLARKDGIRYAIQCKCYSKDLGNKPVQEVNTGKTVYRCQIGVVMTNRYFTKGAKDAADATGVLLWDRDKLKHMIGS